MPGRNKRQGCPGIWWRAGEQRAFSREVLFGGWMVFQVGDSGGDSARGGTILGPRALAIARTRFRVREGAWSGRERCGLGAIGCFSTRCSPTQPRRQRLREPKWGRPRGVCGARSGRLARSSPDQLMCTPGPSGPWDVGTGSAGIEGSVFALGGHEIANRDRRFRLYSSVAAGAFQL